MINMGMRKTDGIDGFWIKPQVEIAFPCLIASALEHPAIKQDPGLSRIDHMPAPCDGSGCTVKGEFHESISR
jgi:hypothetical protein